MHSRAVGRFDVAWWTGDFYCGWPPSPKQGLWYSGCTGVHKDAHTHACTHAYFTTWGTPASLLNSEDISARVCAYTCRASVNPDVSVMFYNDRFTPSRDSTNAHTLSLLSPFPPSPYPRFFHSTRLAWVGDKVSGGVSVCVCVCVFTFNASHTHSVRCHSQGLGTDWAGLQRLYNLVHTLYSCPLVCSTSECVSVCVCVCVQECVQVTVCIPQMARLCRSWTHTHKQTSQLLTGIVLNKNAHKTLISYTLQTTSSTLRQTKLSTKSWHKEAPMRKSAQKKKKNRTGSAYVQSAYDTS